MTSASSYAHYYLPQINPAALLDRNPLQSFDWLSWATNDPRKNRIRYKNMYQKFILYARILPNDFGMMVPEENTPQVWKFVIINNQVVLYAERLSNAHDYIPIIFGQPLEDGLQFQTKSFAQNGIAISTVSRQPSERCHKSPIHNERSYASGRKRSEGCLILLKWQCVLSKAFLSGIAIHLPKAPKDNGDIIMCI